MFCHYQYIHSKGIKIIYQCMSSDVLYDQNFVQKPCDIGYIDMPSLQCVLRWIIKLFLYEKALSQWMHLYGFCPVCILRWIVRLPFWEKALSQWVHLYGFSPVCALICITRLLFSMEALLQWLHWYGFSSVCLFI